MKILERLEYQDSFEMPTDDVDAAIRYAVAFVKNPLEDTPAKARKLIEKIRKGEAFTKVKSGPFEDWKDNKTLREEVFDQLRIMIPSYVDDMIDWYECRRGRLEEYNLSQLRYENQVELPESTSDKEKDIDGLVKYAREFLESKYEDRNVQLASHFNKIRHGELFFRIKREHGPKTLDGVCKGVGYDVKKAYFCVRHYERRHRIINAYRKGEAVAQALS